MFLGSFEVILYFPMDDPAEMRNLQGTYVFVGGTPEANPIVHVSTLFNLVAILYLRALYPIMPL